MQSHEVTMKAGAHPRHKRVGRGRGGGNGKTCGRGAKGDGSRSGAVKFSLKEGGQMPLFRRLPKRGFNNVEFTRRFEVVNIGQLESFEDGSEVTVEALRKAGLVRRAGLPVKVLGDGKLTKRLEVKAHRFSKSAQEKISGCGGHAEVVKAD
ncbi:MAG: 50S ribosomal protein L15 [Phycisphaerae bacterium]|nr:50S ribosomal protein L15 [Phycisphaerae bacterium]